MTGSATALLAVALLSCAARAETEPKRVEIVSVGGYEPVFSTRFVMPFENMIKKSTGVVVVDVENAAAKFTGRAYTVRLDHASPEPGGATAALENTEGVFVLSPAEPRILAAFLAAARGYPLLPPTFERRAKVSSDGASRTFTIETPRAAASQERGTIAVVYHLKVDGKAVDAAFFLKATGGLGRLASALKTLPGDPARRILVSRGTWGFRSGDTTLHGRALWDALETLGVKVSGVGRGELRHWEELESYRKERPGGVKYLSANLAIEGLEPQTVVEAGGVKVAFIAVTRGSYAKYLGRDELKGATLSSPLAAVRDQVKAARAAADLVVVLSNLSQAENARLKTYARGIDAIVGDSEEQPPETHDPNPLRVSGSGRGDFSPALLLADEYDGLDRLEFTVGPKDAAGARDLEVRQSQLVLDDSFEDAPGYPRFMAEEFAIAAGSGTALIPDPRDIFPHGNVYGGTSYPRIVSRDFWTLASTLMADRAGAEAGLMPVTNIGVTSPGDFGEDEVRNWFGWDDSLVAFELPGDDLKPLLEDAEAQQSAEAADIAPLQDKLKLAAGGVGRRNTIHGVQVESGLGYRVVGTRLLLSNTDAYPGLAHAKNVTDLGDLQEEVVADLKKRAAARWTPDRYAELMQGRPVRETPFWTINFRDIGFNLQQSVVVKDAEAFAPVNNSRIQGFNQTDVGVVAKVDVDYRYRTHKWSNSLEVEYSESRIRPPNEPSTLNTPNNRVQYLMTGTEKMAEFPVSWLGESVGPSLGLQYDGEVKQLPYENKRRNVYSAFPGVEIYDGTFIKTLQLTGNIKRDHSTEPVESQYGARLRLLADRAIPVGHGGQGTFQTELWTNYFFRRPRDTDADLLIEGDASMKLQIPIWKELTLAPFVDFYYFKLKSRPLSGYSVQSGVSISFSRLWKPQYEKFF